MWGTVSVAGATDLPWELEPEKALVVLTRESWGCFGGQKILEDVTGTILSDDETYAELEAIVNPEDRNDRIELFLFFPANERYRRLSAYLVLRLGVTGLSGEKPALIKINHARLMPAGDGAVFQLTGTGYGELNAALLHSTETRLSSSFFTCPAAGLFDPQKLEFLPTNVLSEDLTIHSHSIDGKNRQFTITMDHKLLKNWHKVAVCYGLIDEMAREFAPSPASPLNWNRRYISPESLRRAASKIEKEHKVRLQVTVMVYRRRGVEEIRDSHDSFHVYLKKPIVVSDASGKMSGGEVRVGMSTDD